MTPILAVIFVLFAFEVGLVCGSALARRSGLARLARAEADAERWKAEATTYYPPDGGPPVVLPITDVRVRLAEDARRLAAAEAENTRLRVRVAELTAGVGP